MFNKQPGGDAMQPKLADRVVKGTDSMCENRNIIFCRLYYNVWTLFVLSSEPGGPVTL